MLLTLADGTKKDYRAIWMEESDNEVYVIDQRILPFKIQILTSNSVHETVEFIRTMVIRGAPSIGQAAVYGIIQSAYAIYNSEISVENEQFLHHLRSDAELILAARPTAIDLYTAIQTMLEFVNTFI